MIKHRNRNQQSGYTLVEFVMVTVLVGIVAAMAILQMRPTWQDLQTNSGMDQIKAALRTARETAISQRRTIVVKFVATVSSSPCPPAANVFNCVELYQMVVSGSPPTATVAANPFLTLPVDNNVQLGTFSGEVDLPSPDNFVTAGSGISVPNGVYFGNPVVVGGPGSGMEFQSDGTFTDGSGNPINGTLFLMVANVQNSARAVTVLGNTGRIRSWKYTTNGWFQ